MSESGSSYSVCEVSREGEAGVDAVEEYDGPEERRRRKLPIEGR